MCKIGNIQSKLTWWDYGPLLIFALMMALATSSVMPMEQAAFLAAGLNVMGGWISTKKSLEVIDWSLLLMIGSSIGISNAMEQSGLARWLGEKLAGMEASAWNINFLLYLVCLLMTEIVTNNAAAALCMPIALNVAKALELSYKPFTVSIMMASSCGFAIPFGYATHLMVMSPGGYKFIDFIKIGVPLDIIYWIGSCLLGPVIFPFRQS